MSTSILQNSSSAPVTYLEFCERELDPALITLYTKESTGFANSALVRAVAYPILVLSSLAAAAFIAPIFIIVIGFSAVLLLQHVKKVYSSLILKSELAQERVNQLNSLHKHHESLANHTPEQIQQMLKEKGVNFVIGMGPNDSRLTKLKPMLARHLFWEEHIEELKKSQRGRLTLANAFSEYDFASNRDEIFGLQSRAVNDEKCQLVAKVKCAFVSAALFNPSVKGTLEDLGSFSILSGHERAVAAAASVAKANDLFEFKRPNLPAITYDEAKQSTIPQLAMHLYRNMNP